MRTFWMVTRYARAIKFWLFVLLAIGAWLGFGGNAHAVTKSAAQASCNAAFAASHPDSTPPSWAPGDPGWSVVSCGWHQQQTATTGAYYCRNMVGGSGPFDCGHFPYDQPADACTAGDILPGTLPISYAGQTMCRSNGGTYCEVLGAIASEPPFQGFVRGYVVGGSACDPNDYQCPAGWYKDLNGNCTKKPICPDGVGQNPETGECDSPVVCPEGQVKDPFGNCVPSNGECPAGQLLTPEGMCIPGDGQCAEGEVRGSDGTCKRDEDGDGEPDDDDGDGEEEGDDEEKNFTGGESCDAPPQCSGDQIMCGQARIQWRIDCNTRKNARVNFGNCASAPTCTGEGCKPLDVALLVTQWRATCALEKGGSGGESTDNGLEQEAAGLSTDDGTGSIDVGGIWANPEDEEPGSIDTGGYGFARSCPAPPEVFGRSMDLDGFCNLMSLIGLLIASIGLLHAFYVVAGDT